MTDDQIPRQIVHPNPNDPRPDGAVPHDESTVPRATEAGVTPRVFVPEAFRQPCERCGHENVWAFNERLSAMLDWVAVLVDYPEPTDEEEGQP